VKTVSLLYILRSFRVFNLGSFSPSHPSRRDKGGVFTPISSIFVSNDEELVASIMEGKSNIVMSAATH
jgi:hypothetical protein